MGGHGALTIALKKPVRSQTQILCPKTYDNHTLFMGLHGFVFKTHDNQQPASYPQKNQLELGG